MTIYSSASFFFRRAVVFVVFFLASALPARAQGYLWPTDASHFINSTFGEYRPGHFHSGIDIKTWEKEGYRVFAVRNGYVYRVRISPFGYGKALYLKLDTGEIAVYGHLQRFAPKIQRVMKALQRKRQKYSVEKYFTANQIPVKKGEVVAFSGRTGIGAPHLHFEIRDAKNRPINPLLKYPFFKDRVPPRITGFAVIPFGKNSQVEGRPLPQTFPVRHKKGTVVYLDHPIQVWGNFGLAVTGFDRSAKIPNKCSFYRLKLLVDGTPVFQTEYDSLSFDQTHEIVFDRNFRLHQWTGRYFNNLFLRPENRLPFYHPSEPGAGLFETAEASPSERPPHSPAAGFSGRAFSIFPGNPVPLQPVTLRPGKHYFTVIAEDFTGNRATLNGILLVEPKKISPIRWERFNDHLQITNPTPDELFAAQWIGKKWDPLSLQALLGADPSPSDFPIDIPISKAVRWFKFWTLSNLGFDNFPIFVSADSGASDLPTLFRNSSLKKIFLDDFLLIRLRTAGPLAQPLQLVYNTGFSTGVRPLRQLDLTRYETTLSLDSIANAFTLFSIQDPVHKKRIPIDFVKLFKIETSQEKEIPLSQDGSGIRFLKNSAYQPLFFRFEKLPLRRAHLSVPGDSITYLLQLNPADIPLRRGAILSLHIPDGEKNPKQLAVYSPSKRRWVFQGNTLSADRRNLKVHLRHFGRFTILRDTTPPSILARFPRHLQVISSTRPKIAVRFKDNLSGIENETSIRLTLDGKFCIAEYDPEMSRITYRPDKPLQNGKHLLRIRIVDRCGNSVDKRWSFIIKARKKP
ncbi:MAG: M23 family metallopeptidase [Calditrichaeota bacterium]|nr:M23 family metallopeptidase [Calditrichota bacterium]